MKSSFAVLINFLSLHFTHFGQYTGSCHRGTSLYSSYLLLWSFTREHLLITSAGPVNNRQNEEKQLLAEWDEINIRVYNKIEQNINNRSIKHKSVASHSKQMVEDSRYRKMAWRKLLSSYLAVYHPTSTDKAVNISEYFVPWKFTLAGFNLTQCHNLLSINEEPSVTGVQTNFLLHKWDLFLLPRWFIYYFSIPLWNIKKN